MKVLLLDNFDSFTFNLFHYLEAFGCDVTVARNNAIRTGEVEAFDKIVLSPGPGLPADAGIMPSLIAEYVSRKPVLGVCLGMQAIGEYFGGTLYNQPEVKHGVSAKCTHDGDNSLFRGVPEEFEAGLYHSWAVSLPEDSPLKPVAYSGEGVLMAFEHRDLPVFGVQFHPESILTPEGRRMVRNFVDL